ncbi:uncharacterized protein ACIQIH_005350 isoform 1-T1 [Cyanocitta cristata]
MKSPLSNFCPYEQNLNKLIAYCSAVDFGSHSLKETTECAETTSQSSDTQRGTMRGKEGKVLECLSIILTDGAPLKRIHSQQAFPWHLSKIYTK